MDAGTRSPATRRAPLRAYGLKGEPENLTRPNDQCQAHHVGYVLKGKFGVRTADGVEEIFEAGDAFTIDPGHIPIAFAGSEYVAFTPAEEARQQAAVMMPNVMKYAEEHGIEIPPELRAPAH